MDNEIKNLREALGFSPENIPLRLLLAQALLNKNFLVEAEEEFQKLIKVSSGEEGKFGLAQVFFRKEEYSKCNVLLEELISNSDPSIETFALHAKTLLKEEEIALAIEAYQKVLALDPNYQDEELDSHLRQGVSSDQIDESELLSPFVQMPDINFNQVGGMERVKSEIDLKIIKPLEHPDLYKAYGKTAGGGILLYGPPGCGKTYVAKATAGQVNARFITVGLQDILDMWIGNSEKNLHGLFEIAREHTPCVLFFDENRCTGSKQK